MITTRISIVLLLLSGISIFGDAPRFKGALEPVVIERGPHHRVWQTVTEYENQDGGTLYTTNSYVELATGLHYLENGEWVDANEQIEVENGRAIARRGQHRASFARNLNSKGAVELITPEGKRFRSHILGLAYTDSQTLQTVLIAELKNSQGVIVHPNQVYYEDAFAGDCIADVRYTYTIAGFEQDIILITAPPSPAEYGLNPDTTRLEVLTEFIEAPEATVHEVVVRKKTDDPRERGLIDQSLDFGVMKIAAGHAFPTRNGDPLAEGSVPTGKTWERIEGRLFLIEQVDFDSVVEELGKLPLGARNQNRPPARPQTGRKLMASLPAPPEGSQGTWKDSDFARLDALRPGLVLDYLTVNGSMTNYVFRGDMTYWVSGVLNLYGTTVIEGGAVLKFASAASSQVSLYGPVDCQTTPWHPAILTARDDNTVGEIISGSTGNPTGLYALYGIAVHYTGGLLDLHDLRIRYATYGAVTYGNTTAAFRNVQISECTRGVGWQSGTTMDYDNVLFYKLSTAFYNVSTTSTNRVRNATFHRITYFLNTSNYTVSVTNSLLISVTNNFAYTGVGNGFSSSDSGIFLTVGSGAHYLAAGSPYRDIGATSIPQSLLNGLKTMTTYPPQVIGTNIINNLTLGVFAARDTNAPDAGYHYDAADYLLAEVSVNAATLTIGEGVVMAIDSRGTNFGIRLNSGGTIISAGSALKLNRFVRSAAVQELLTGTNRFPSFADVYPAPAIPTSLRLRFTDLPIPANSGSHLFQAFGQGTLSNIVLMDSQLRGSALRLSAGVSNMVLALTNNLVDRVNVTLHEYKAGTALAFNNLFREGVLNVNATNANWIWKDNLFDKTALTNTGVSFIHDYNGYITNYGRLNVPYGGHDQILLTSPVYERAYLGRYYLPASSPQLIGLGSLSDASQRGFYHYTTTTNQVKETNSVLDIGLHYVALNAQNQPSDIDGDGIPDYVEDSNGNQPPVITLPSGPLNYISGEVDSCIDTNALITDVDTSTMNLGSLTISFGTNWQSGDLLGVCHQGTGPGQIGVSVTTVTNIQYEGITIGICSGGCDSQPLVISFNSQATCQAICALARKITYANTNLPPANSTRLAQFTVEDGEGGTAQASQTITVACPVAMDVMLVFDRSQSVEIPFPLMKAAALNFVRYFEEVERVGFVAFCGTVDPTVPLEYVDSADTLKAKLGPTVPPGLDTCSGTALHPPFVAATNQLHNNPRTDGIPTLKVIVMISDGWINFAGREQDIADLEAAADSAKASGIRIVSFKYIPDHDPPSPTDDESVLMTKIASPKPGTSQKFYYFSPTVNEMPQKYAELAADLCRRNAQPSMDPIANQTIDEDAPQQNITLTGITAGPSTEASQSITITAWSSDTSIISDPVITYTSPNATGTLSFTPQPNRYTPPGPPVTITVRVQDNGGTANGGRDTLERTFTVTVNPVNDPPNLWVKGLEPDPVIRASQPTGGSARTVALSANGQTAYIADEWNGVRIYSVANDSLNELGSIPDIWCFGLALSPTGDKLYVADYFSGLNVYSLANPTSPALIGSEPASGYIGVSLSRNGLRAFVISDQVLTILDVSNPADPTYLGSLGGFTQIKNPPAFSADGNFAYLPTDDYLQVLNVSNPSDPQLLNGLFGGQSSVAVSEDGTLLVSAGAWFLTTWDIANPASPNPVGWMYSWDQNWDIKLSRDKKFAYLTSASADLEVVALSNLVSPIIIKRLAGSGWGSSRLVLSSDDNRAYTANFEDGLSIIDIGAYKLTLPEDSAPFRVDLSVTDPDNTASSLILTRASGNTALLPLSNVTLGGSGENRFVNIFPVPDQYGLGTITLTVTDPQSLTAAKRINVTVENVNDPPTISIPGLEPDIRIVNSVAGINALNVALSPNGTRAYVADGVFGWVRVFDISDPGNPLEVGGGDLPTPGPILVTRNGQRAFVISGTSLYILDISQDATGLLGSWALPEAANRGVLSPDETKLYLAGTAGLRIMNVADPANVTPLGTYGGIVGEDIALSPNGLTAYLVAADDGLYAINVNNPGVPTLLGSTDAPFGESFRRIQFSKDPTKAFVEGYYWMYVMDVSSLNDMHPVAQVQSPTVLMNMARSSDGKRVYLVGEENYYKIVDVSNPLAPDLEGQAQLTAFPWDMVPTYADEHLFVAEGNSLVVVDIGSYKLTIPANTTSPPFDIKITDLETPADSLDLDGTSDNQTLLPDSGIALSGSGENRSATLMPAANQIGNAIITMRVTDGDGGTAEKRVKLTVVPSVTIQLAEPADGRIFAEGQNIPWKATLANAEQVTTVNLVANGVVVSSGPYSGSPHIGIWQDASGGTYTIFAQAIAAGTPYDSSSRTIIVNRKPIVDAFGPSQVTLPATASLSGTVTDPDNFPPGPSNLKIAWSKDSGPGTVAFSPDPADPSNPRLAIGSFSLPGTYVLRLTASDTIGSAFDTVTILVLKNNEPPVVLAGPDQTIEYPARVYLPGRVTDDGLPSPPTLTISWSKVSGPGTVTFDDPTQAETMAAFSMSGTYVLRLRGHDGAPNTFCDPGQTIPGVCDNVTVYVKERPDVEVFKNVDYVSAGVGMRPEAGASFYDAGFGQITLSGIAGPVRKAYLYWNGPIDVENPNANAEVVVNGHFVVGQNIGISHNNCWPFNYSVGYLHVYGSSHSYRADVTPIVRATGNGSYFLQNFYKSPEININGASLVVFFDSEDPQNNGDLLLYQGNDSNIPQNFGPNGPVYAVAVQQDGKVILGGDFTAIGAIPRNRIARLLPDGEMDHTFRLFAGVNGPVKGIAVQANGKIVVAGEFTNVNGEPRNHIAQLEADGSLGEAFNHDVNGVINCLVQQVPSGEIYVGGAFSMVGETIRSRIARFTPDGALDSLDPELEHNLVNAIALETNGPTLLSIVVGGSYLDGEDIRGKVSRVQPGGVVETAFNPDLDDAVYAVRLQQNGNVLIGGAFTELAGDPHPHLARLLPSGVPDESFYLTQAPDDTVFAIERFHNGDDEEIFIGGSFTHMGTTERRGLVHLYEWGTVDHSAQYLYGQIHTLLLPDPFAIGILYAGGSFNDSGFVNVCLYTWYLSPAYSGDNWIFSPSDSHWGVVFPPFNFTGGTPTLQLHVSDGQAARDDSVYFNGEVLFEQGNTFQGTLGALWDITSPPLQLSPPFVVSGFNRPILRTGPTPLYNDCISLVAAILKLPAQSVPPPPTPPVPRPPWVPPVARDDVITVARELGNAVLHVLGNDTSADGFPLRITTVSSPAPEAGVAQTIYEGTAILFTPTYASDPHPDQATFSYTVVDRNGYTASANVTIAFTGAFALPLNDPVDVVPQTYFQRIISEVLTDDDPNDKPSIIRGGDERAHHYRFVAAEGDYVNVSIQSDEGSAGLPLHLYLRDPLGRVIASSSHTFRDTPPDWSYDHAVYVERFEHSGMYTIEVASHTPNDLAIYGQDDWGSYEMSFSYGPASDTFEPIVLNNGIRVPEGDLIDLGNERTKTIRVRNIGKSDLAWPTMLSFPSGSAAFTAVPNRLPPIPAGHSQIVTISVKDVTPGDKIGTLRFLNEGDWEPWNAWDFTVKLHANTSVPPGSRNSPPVLANDEFIAYVNSTTPTICDVLANDVDPDGDPLRIVAISEAGFGQVTTNSAGTVAMYLPDSNTFGTDSFTYTVYDGRGAARTAVAVVKVRNREVQILAPPAYDPNGTPPNVGENVVVNISAATTDGFIMRIAFYTNGVENFNTNASPYIFNWVPGAPGFYQIKAIAWDEKGTSFESETRIVGVSVTGDLPAMARIDNLVDGQVVREGLFRIYGTADDPDDTPASGDDLAYTFALYELVPSSVPLEPAQSVLVSSFSVTYPGTPPPSAGKKVVDGLLGTLDFTRVRNGVYELELRVTQNARTVTKSVSFTLDSEAKIGQFTFSVTDLEVTMGNIPFAIVRTYDSFNLKQGDFGVGWTLSMNNVEVKLDEDRQWTLKDPDIQNPEPDDYFPMRVAGSRDITLTLPDGRRTTFAFTLAPPQQSEEQENFATMVPKWIAPPGIYATLKPIDEEVLQFVPWQNVIEPYWSSTGLEVHWENYDFRGYVLTNADGMRYDIIADSPGVYYLEPADGFLRWVRPYFNPRLKTIRSRAGERIEIDDSNPGNVIVKHFATPVSSDAVVTRTLSILRDGSGRVTKVYSPKHVNPDGTLIGAPEPALEYEYVGDKLVKVHKLVKVEPEPPHTRLTTEYQYTNPNHPYFITAILDGRKNAAGEDVAAVLPQPDAQGRLGGFTAADGAQLMTITHDLSGQREIIQQPTSSAGDPASTVVQYDTRGRIVRTTDPLGNSTEVTYDDVGNVLTQTDPLGNVTSYEYDSRGHRTRTVNPNNAERTTAYNRFGQLLWLRDPKVNAEFPSDPSRLTVENYYDALTGNLATSLDINEEPQVSVFYTMRNQIDVAYDVLNTETKHQYYSAEAGGRFGDLRSVTVQHSDSGILSFTTYTYDGAGNRLTEIRKRTLPSGAEELTTTTYVYDEQNRLIETRDPLNNSKRTQFNEASKPVATFDELDRKTQYLYDIRYNLIQTTHPWDDSDPRKIVERTVYDSRDRLLFTQDKAECVGWPYGETTAHGTRYVYDHAGRVVQTERLKNLKVRILTDETQERPWPEPEVVSFEVVGVTTTLYDAAGRVVQSIDARGFDTSYAYDKAGRRTHITNALGQITSFGYDDNGNQTSMTDAVGRFIEYGYDEFNRRTVTKLPLLQGQSQHSYLLTLYDKLGRRVAETNQDNVINRFLYDRLGRLIAVTNAHGTPDAVVTRYGYDQLGHFIQQTNAAGQVTTFTYNEVGRRVGRTLPGGATELYFFDPVGNMTIRTNFRGGILHFEYDVHNWLRKKIDPINGDPTFPLAVYTYYPNGLRATLSDSSHTIHPEDEGNPPYRDKNTYQYDEYDRLRTKEIWNGSLLPYTFTYEYDPNGNLARLNYVYYQWDPLNRLTNVLGNHYIGGNQSRTVYRYDTVGNLSEYEYLTGVKTALGYDEWNRLRSVTTTRGVTPIASFGYTLLNRGNRDTLTEDIQGRQRSVSYSYDSLDRLTRETISGVIPEFSSPSGAITYDATPGYGDTTGFDKVSNRRSRTDTLDPEFFPYPDQSFTYDTRDRLDSDLYDLDGNTLGPVGTPTQLHDKYDLENRLTTRTREMLIDEIPFRQIIDLVYDADGHRVRKANTYLNITDPENPVLDWQKSYVINYYIDDRNPTGYAQVIDEMSYTPGYTRSYEYGLDLISQQVQVSGNYEVRFYGYDGHGSVRYLTKADVTWVDNQQVWDVYVTDTYTYDAFGVLLEQRARSGTDLILTIEGGVPTPNNYLYVGEQWDTNLGLYYNRARYLSPDTGRFWSQDAFEGDQSQPMSLHGYLYAQANPGNRVDPSGNLSIVEVTYVADKQIRWKVQDARRLAPYARGVRIAQHVQRTIVDPPPVLNPAPYAPQLGPIAKGFAAMLVGIIVAGNIAQVVDAIANTGEDDNDKLIYYHYSQSPPASFGQGLFPPAWVTTLSGLDSAKAMFGFGIKPPLYEYTFKIDPLLLGPANVRTPGGWPYVQYEVLSPTGPGSMVSWRNVPQTHGGAQKP
jgi:RHS repeat-associated protein